MKRRFLHQIRVGLIAGSLLLSGWARAAEPGPDPEKLEAGKAAFATGVTLIQDPEGARYDEALVQFRRAYELTGSWKALGNMALCLFKLERDGEAIDAYERYLNAPGNDLDASDRAQVERDLQALKAQVVTVEIELPQSGITIIDLRADSHDNRIVNEYSSDSTLIRLGLHPGRHTIFAKLPGGDVRWEAKLDPGSSVSHKFELSGAGKAVGPAPVPATGSTGSLSALPASERRAGPDLRIPAYASFGMAALGIGAGTLFALKSRATSDRVDALCNGKQCPLNRRDEIRGLQDDANQQGRLAWIGFAVGGAGVAAGVTLLVLGDHSSSTGKNPGARAAIAAFVGVDAVGIGGRF